MSNRFNSDEEVLARLVREAGYPSVAPNADYAETLRAEILNRVTAEELNASGQEVVQAEEGLLAITTRRSITMKRLTELAVAAIVLVAIGLLVFWGIGGGSTNFAFAEIVKALDKLQSVTYDDEARNDRPDHQRLGRHDVVLACAYQRVLARDAAHIEAPRRQVVG